MLDASSHAGATGVIAVLGEDDEMAKGKGNVL